MTEQPVTDAAGRGSEATGGAESHDVRLSERTDHRLGSPSRFRAECVCGWAGDWHATAVGAGAEANQHQALARHGWSGDVAGIR
jgi:hypothetical protein